MSRPTELIKTVMKMIISKSKMKADSIIQDHLSLKSTKVIQSYKRVKVNQPNQLAHSVIYRKIASGSEHSHLDSLLIQMKKTNEVLQILTWGGIHFTYVFTKNNFQNKKLK